MPPTPPHRISREISPELVLVDRELLPSEQRASLPPAQDDAREAMLRICELSDVNPPRRRRLVAYGGPVTLWAEAVVLVTAHVPLGVF